MRRSSKEIERRIARGAERLAPDKGAELLLTPVEKATGEEEYLRGLTRKRREHAAGYRALALAASLVMVIALTVGWQFGFTACYAVELDANPSVTLTLNRMEQVLSAEANNEDGQAVLEALGVERLTCDEAVERILGRMLDLGYLQEGQGQVLLCVQERGGRNGEAIRSRLSREADTVLGRSLEEHGVFSRMVPGDKRPESADRYGITAGKAYLAETLAKDHPDLEAGKLCRMPVWEMMDLLNEKDIDLTPYGTYTGTPWDGGKAPRPRGPEEERGPGEKQNMPEDVKRQEYPLQPDGTV